MKDLDFEIEVVPGITSFTGCAAAAGISLVEKDEILVIVPKVDERLGRYYGIWGYLCNHENF